jgi:hypothetical protein
LEENEIVMKVVTITAEDVENAAKEMEAKGMPLPVEHGTGDDGCERCMMVSQYMLEKLQVSMPDMEPVAAGIVRTPRRPSKAKALLN